MFRGKLYPKSFVRSKSVCSDKSEVVSGNSKTPVLKFYGDCNQKSIHTINFFSSGSIKIDFIV